MNDKRVGVIGAGISGLVTAKVLRDVAEGGEVSVGELTSDADCPLVDARRGCLAEELPNHWPSRKPVPVKRWVEAIDRCDGATL